VTARCTESGRPAGPVAGRRAGEPGPRLVCGQDAGKLGRAWEMRKEPVRVPTALVCRLVKHEQAASLHHRYVVEIRSLCSSTFCGAPTLPQTSPPEREPDAADTAKSAKTPDRPLLNHSAHRHTTSSNRSPGTGVWMGEPGGLPAEAVTHGYNNDDEPNALACTYSYLQSTTYSAYDQVAQVKPGTAGSYATAPTESHICVRRSDLMIPSPQCQLRPHTPPRQGKDDDEYEYRPQSSLDPCPLSAGGDGGGCRGGRVPRGGSPG
jgi:hypothetical protein